MPIKAVFLYPDIDFTLLPPYSRAAKTEGLMIQTQQAMNAQAHIGFQIPCDLFERVQQLIQRIQHQPDSRQLSCEAADVLSILLHKGIQSFYFDIVEEVPTHAATRKSADTGIITVTKGADLVIRKMANNLEPHELQLFAQYLGQLLFQQGDHCYLAFPLDRDSHSKLEQVFQRIQQDNNTDAYNHLIVDALCQLADLAVQHFYHQPTRLIKIRLFVKKSADLGIRTAQKGMHFVIRLMFRKTRQQELMQFSACLQNQLVYLPSGH